ncbi:MAG: class I SAM-dependent methyltransferase [Methylococcales bacterium]|nr:class I SAM-dependent methyltransferase [Methylococcales bacterium]
METKLIPTLNNMGWMITQHHLDIYTQSFIDYALTASKPVLEVGAAYGVAAPHILKQGGKIIVNDLDSRHLECLYAKTPVHLRSNLTLLAGSCVDEIEIERGSLSAILCGRVFHFFDAQTISLCLERFARWLEPNGKVFIIADSIFHGMNEPIFADFLQRKSTGCPNPGRVSLADNQRLATHPNKEGILAAMPEYFNFIDIETMANLLNKTGFLIEQASYFPARYYDEVSLWNGREGVGLVSVLIR